VGVVLVLSRTSAPPSNNGALFPATQTPSNPLPVDLLALQMEDHYVRVHTPHGSELILMPLGSAIAGVTTEGLRTHRSWWVARHAVTAVEGTSRAMRLHLSNGVVAPVSRSAVVHLKSAGWIAA
jgi:DNA-binding LytR/AlgR family response regulator